VNSQRKALTLIVFWCLVALAAWVLPWGYEGEETAAASGSPAAEPTPTPTTPGTHTVDPFALSHGIRYVSRALTGAVTFWSQSRDASS
jgi:hypothetical protein